MKRFKSYLAMAVIGITALTAFESCTKKGEDDPAVSLRTRKDRFTNTWTLTKYEINGENQDISGSIFTYEVYNSGRLIETVEGAVFGVPTKTIREGSWEFINEQEDVKLTFDDETLTYNVQRLASDELWLKKLQGADTHVYYFEGK